MFACGLRSAWGGELELLPPGYVRTTGTSGYVVADGVRVMPVAAP